MKLFDDRICHLTFSHTDCSDIWPAYFGEMKKYFQSGMKHHVCLNQLSSDLPEEIQPLLYTPGTTYPRRLLECLNQLSDYDYVFFDHEDMFLYAKPDGEELRKYYEVLKSGALDHIRLIKGGSHKSTPWPGIPSLHKLDLRSKWIFSIQPSFWKIETLKQLLELNLDVNIWDLERRSQQATKDIQLKAAHSYASGRRRGLFHFDNTVYPYVATAIGKGKWNYSEYKKELGKVFAEYDIDPKKRGINFFLHR